jgi:hypothetical protein
MSGGEDTLSDCEYILYQVGSAIFFLLQAPLRGNGSYITNKDYDKNVYVLMQILESNFWFYNSPEFTRLLINSRLFIPIYSDQQNYRKYNFRLCLQVKNWYSH